MNRFRLAVLLLILGMILAASPALAGKPGQSPNTVNGSLVPPDIGPPEPHARGKYTATCSEEWPTLMVTCRRLTPMKQYYFVALFIAGPWNAWWETYPVTADGNGDLSAELLIGVVPAFARLENDEGDVVLVER